MEPKRLSDEALQHLSRLEFPGNVRQLENLCHWLTVMAPGQVVDVSDLPAEFRGEPPGGAPDWLGVLQQEAERRLARGETGLMDALGRQMDEQARVLDEEYRRLDDRHAPIDALAHEMEAASKPMEAIGAQMEAQGRLVEEASVRVEAKLKKLMAEDDEDATEIDDRRQETGVRGE